MTADGLPAAPPAPSLAAPSLAAPPARDAVPRSPTPVSSSAAARAAAGRAAGARAAGARAAGARAAGARTVGATATARVPAPPGAPANPPPARASASPVPTSPAPAGPATARPAGNRLATATLAPRSSPPPAAPTDPPPAADPGPPAGRARRLPVVLAATLGVIILLGSCTVFAFRVVQDELAGRDAQADAGESPAPVERDISNRKADPEPLTAKEVFPTDKIVINPDEPPYKVLRTQKSEDCTVAAADALGNLVRKLGCNHVVRATLRSPDKGYLISGGIFNLKTEANAERVYDEAEVMIEKKRGRFLGLLAGDDTEPILLSETNVGWDYRGHFVIYLIVARADGKPLSEVDNRHSKLILWDIAEVHLRTNVLDARAIEPAGGA